MKLINYRTSIAVVVLIIISCSKQETPTEITKEIPGKENHAPKIVTVAAEPSSLYVNSESQLSCDATDEDRDTLKIVWSCEKGTLPNGNSGKTVKYISPSSICTDIITVKVSDKNLTVESKIEINIVEKGTINHPAKIISITATPDTIPQGQSTVVECIATDEDGDSLRIWWEARKLGAGNNNGYKITMGTYLGDYGWGSDTLNVFVSDNKVITKGRLPFYVGALPFHPLIVYPPMWQKDVDPSPKLIWRKSNADSYSLQVAKDEGFTSLIVNEINLKDTTKQLYNLDLNKIYYWRIKPKNKYGEYDWDRSSRLFFTTARGPIIPTILTPVNNRTIPPWLIKFSWNAFEDYYDLQISEDPNFLTMVYSKNDLTSTSVVMQHLTQGTQYFWRVSSTNKYGTSPFSEVRSFKVANIGNANPTSCGNATYVEYQGEKYNIVQIGTQCWFKENLKVGTFTSKYTKQTDNGVIEKYCYNNDEKNCEIYGGLYFLDEAMNYAKSYKAKGICPEGWHIPTVYEYWILNDFVKGNGNQLKAIGEGSGTGEGTNTTGFSALMAGWLYPPNYSFEKYGARFWTSGDEINGYSASSFSIWSTTNELKDEYDSNYYGYSLRCIKD